MKILVTIPTWNEAVVIERNLGVLQAAIQKYLPQHDVMIEVADNGSTDGTVEIVGARFPRPVRPEGGGTPPLRVTQIDQRGKGLAIRRSWGRHLDDADVLIFTDADLAADLAALPSLVDPIVRGEADLVCASRFVEGAVAERALSREIASRLYRFLQRTILHLPVKDAQCGLKAISSHAARRLLPRCEENGWMFDSELLAFAAADRFRVREIPVRWVEHRDPRRRSAIRLFRHGWSFLAGITRIWRRLRGA